LLVVGLACARASVAQPPVLEAQVDRGTVHANESFTYVLRAEGQLRGEPDLRALEGEFEVLDRSRTTRIQIVGGQTVQVGEWFVQLMPRAAGRYVLPPVELGGARSNPVEVEVLAPRPGAAAGDIFLEVEASPATVYVQSQVVYTLRVLRSVSTGRATLSPPRVAGGEAIVEQLGPDREYQTVRDGRTFIVREQRFAVFPEQAGLLTIEPAAFEAVVIAPSGFSSVQRFQSDAVQFRVEPPAPPPAEYPNAAWLPAQKLTITESWSDPTDPLTTGVPATRTIVVEADGLLETQLPEVRFAQDGQVRQYVDQPELGRESTADGLRSRRIERFAVIAQAPGTLRLPPLEIPWWNVAERRWAVARLPARSIDVVPSPEQGAQPPVSPPASAPAEPRVAAHLWQALSGALLVAWLATLWLWRRAGDRRGGPREAAQPQPRPPSAGRLLRQLRAACRGDDAPAARRLLIEWAAVRWPDAPPRSLGALAAKLPPPLAAEVETLEARVFGRAAVPWRGEGLAGALAGLEGGAANEEGAGDDALLPLYR
jgi:hypothetical protein